MEESLSPTQDEKLKSYKTVCTKLGIVMIVYFVCRILAHFFVYAVSNIDGLASSSTLLYFVQTSIMVLLVYIVPTVVAFIIFKSAEYYFGENKLLRRLYEKPKRLAKALGTFPALYGLGYGVNLLTILAFFLIRVISRNLDVGVEIQQFFEPLTFEPPKDLISAFILVFLMVVVAAVVEEFLVRGIMYDALKPYGAGVAIIISSVIFGLMHGSLQMFFYTTVLGFALGYIRYATDSLLVVTILHAMINAVAAGLMFFLSLIEITDGENVLIISLSHVYMVAMLALVVLGIVAIIKRIPVIRRYKITNEWTEISPKKKIAIFVASVPVIIMLILAIDEHVGNLLIGHILY